MNHLRSPSRLRSASILTAVMLTAAGLGPALASAEVWRFSGEAKSLEGEYLYNSYHRIQGECRNGLWRPIDHEVRYTKGEGQEPFATKTLSYDLSQLRPSFTFRQPRFDEVMSVENIEDERLIIEWQTNEGGTENYRVPIEGRMVVDAGFDNLVRLNWPTLMAGDSVDFRFLAPTRGKAYDFVLEPAEDDRIPSPHVFSIRPTGFVLGFLVDPIVLGYDDQGALTHYLGLTNVRKDSDTNFTAHVRYNHQQTPECPLVE